MQDETAKARAAYQDLFTLWKVLTLISLDATGEGGGCNPAVILCASGKSHG
jgi:hypothetical protein